MLEYKSPETNDCDANSQFPIPFFEGSHQLLPWAISCFRNPAKFQSYSPLDQRRSARNAL